MSSAILDLVKINEKMDYSILIPLAILYVLVFWLIVSVWVGYDAYKRFKNNWKAFGFFLLNMIFWLPFTVLYMLVRPIDELSETEAELDHELGGVNVPVINFVGKDGVVMSLELKINSSKLTTEQTPEMKVDISFDPQNSENLQISVKNADTEEVKTVIDSEKLIATPAIEVITKDIDVVNKEVVKIGFFSKLKKMFAIKKKNEKKNENEEKPTTEAKTEEEPTPLNEVEKNLQIAQDSKKKKKKHKKHR